MSRRGVQDRLVLPVSAWPSIDRELWVQGTQPMSGLRRHRHADTLRPASIANAWKAYGRFLAVLADHDLIDPVIGPADRVNRENVALLFDALREENNCDNTIKQRLLNLRVALRIMVSRGQAVFDWVTRPAGFALDTLIPTVPRDDIFVPEAVTLFRWGLQLMEGATPACPHAQLRFYRKYRDGLMIALLACRAPRIGSVVQMRLGINLDRRGGEYWVRLQSAIVKNRRTLEYSLPATLTPLINRYLAEIRPYLLDATTNDAVWGNGGGATFTYNGIEQMIRRRSTREFPEVFGPHRFRHAFASSLAAADPTNPSVAAVVLGISEAVVHAHYRKARQIDAALKLTAHFIGERERTRIVAEKVFKQRSRS